VRGGAEPDELAAHHADVHAPWVLLDGGRLVGRKGSDAQPSERAEKRRLEGALCDGEGRRGKRNARHGRLVDVDRDPIDEAAGALEPVVDALFPQQCERARMQDGGVPAAIALPALIEQEHVETPPRPRERCEEPYWTRAHHEKLCRALRQTDHWSEPSKERAEGRECRERT
jgi:hypothetical protein